MSSGIKLILKIFQKTWPSAAAGNLFLLTFFPFWRSVWFTAALQRGPQWSLFGRPLDFLLGKVFFFLAKKSMTMTDHFV